MEFLGKYESSNHLAPTVDVRNADGSVTTMQGLDPAAFGAFAVGRHVRKAAYEPDAIVNDRPVPIVPGRRWNDWGKD